MTQSSWGGGNAASITAKIKLELCKRMSPDLAGTQHVVKRLGELLHSCLVAVSHAALASGGCWHASAAAWIELVRDTAR